MNNKNQVLLVFCALLLLTAGGYYFLFSKPDNAGNTVADNTFGWKFPIVKFPITGPGGIAYSDIRDPGGIPQGLPVRLKIPTIGVNSAIEDALITPDGRMDVPAGSVNVAWFSLGPHPGEIGSAVIGGHFGIRNGVKFVFYDLDKLKVGDKVYIEDDKGDTLTFMVRSIKLFDRNASAETVFTSNDGLAHLNLITCEGIWNRVNGNYPARRVVFTDAITSESAPAIAPSTGGGITKAEDIATFPRSLGIGSKGADVTALQTVLHQKGFLTLPPGVSYGFFGALTASAIKKYQISSGLSPVGIFGPQTKAKLLAELGGDTGLPNAGTDETATGTIAEKAKSPFATPVNMAITALFLLALLFVVFKILKR